MPKFKVCVWQEVIRFHTVTVTAENEADAREKARDKANDHSGPWKDEEVQDDGVDSIEVVK